MNQPLPSDDNSPPTLRPNINQIATPAVGACIITQVPSRRQLRKYVGFAKSRDDFA